LSDHRRAAAPGVSTAFLIPLETIMTRFAHLSTAALMSATLFASQALAHVTLEGRQAAIGASYKAVFRVPHGCSGSPTVKLRVQIPEGVINAKPMPKPGWTLEIVKGKYKTAYDYYGTQLSEGAKEIVWSGGRLADDNYDEFIVNTYLAAGLPANTTLYFPVVQECENGVHRWIDIPAEGKSPDDYETPAPGVKLVPKA
jgi:uncharacterized protein YcnI